MPLIADICRIAGTPGLSFGVLHNGELIHQASVGLRNVDAQLPADDDTVYMIASLTKAFTAAMVGILVDDGKLDWTTQLQEVVPEFKRQDAAANITVADLLSHRTGLSPHDSLWLLSNNEILWDRAVAILTLQYVPAAAPLRTEFVYNNMGYEALGHVIEKASGSDYASFLRDRVLKPLGMNRTFYTNPSVHNPNLAVPYIALANATPFQIPQPVYGENVLMGAAGGIRTTVGDLLRLYNGLIDAAHNEIDRPAAAIRPNPLKGLKHIWRGMISLPVSTVREYSYAAGWFRAQLPATPPKVFDDGPGANPMLGEGLPSRLGLFHGGNIPGFTSWAAIFPETSSAVVVLSNSLPLADTVRLVGQILVEELFGNTINATAYREYAKSASRRSASTMSAVKAELLQHKTVDTPIHPLEAYVGKYYNSIGSYFIEIRKTAAGGLRLLFMGSDSDGFDLEPYQHSSFFWWMPHDELARRARYTDRSKEYYIIEFDNSNDEEPPCTASMPRINSLWWKHESALQGKGERFSRRDHEATVGLCGGTWEKQLQRPLSSI